MGKNAVTVWNNCLELIKQYVSEDSFRTWFLPIVPLKLADDTLTIQVPSQFYLEWLEEHFINVLGQAINQEIGPNGKLVYYVILDGGNEKNKPIGINMTGGGANTSAAAAAFQPAKKPTTPVQGSVPEIGSPFDMRPIQNHIKESHLNAQLTFESFIEGNCNRLARSAGEAVAVKPGTTAFNPLLIWGGVGLGKTHLINAIGNRIKQVSPEKFVLYVSTQKFTDQFVEHARNNRMKEFNDFYMQVDVLLLDDIQLLTDRTGTQEILFTMFNHMHQRNRQIVITSDCPPKDLRGLSERLLSRFKWGLNADLQMPDFETRIAIIQKKMQRDGINIPIDVVEYLAHSVDTNIRELEGVLVSLVAQTSFNGREFSLGLAKQIIQSIVHNIENEVDMDFIQAQVSDFYKISPDSLKAKTKKKEIVMARMVAMYFAREFTGYSLETIGDFFGGRHHSTVIHAIQSVSGSIESDRTFKNQIQELQSRMKVK